MNPRPHDFGDDARQDRPPQRKFADWSSRAWEEWRAREREGKAPPEFCKACGWVHRRGNCGPRREE